jgi:[pyruvate, water dikinase]-phosphate phosphotransferase / [pyruvate, water dikinase] kinase
MRSERYRFVTAESHPSSIQPKPISEKTLSMTCAYNQGMKIHHVFIVSNATGLSAETTARASLAQFKLEANSTKFHLFARCSSTKEFEQIVIDAKECGGLIVYTLGDALWAELLADLAEKHGVPALDLLTPIVALMARTFNLEPTQANLPHHHLTEEYFRRVDAVEFTVNHDDGRLPQRLTHADIILIGVSRSSKTPLSMYLANLGYKVANVPLVPGIQPPKELFELPHHKVYATSINLEVLLEIRRNRVRTMGTHEGGEYADPERVQVELDYAESIVRRGRFPMIDVTGRAIEETANEILRLYERHANRNPGS